MTELRGFHVVRRDAIVETPVGRIEYRGLDRQLRVVPDTPGLSPRTIEIWRAYMEADHDEEGVPLNLARSLARACAHDLHEPFDVVRDVDHDEDLQPPDWRGERLGFDVVSQGGSFLGTGMLHALANPRRRSDGDDVLTGPLYDLVVQMHGPRLTEWGLFASTEDAAPVCALANALREIDERFGISPPGRWPYRVCSVLVESID